MATKELKVKITAHNKDLKEGLNDSKKQVEGFSGVVKQAGIALLAAFAAKAVFNGIKRMVVDLGNMADRLLDLEQITGISTDRLQEYEQVARVAGVNSETLANAVQGLTQRMARGNTEASPLNIALRQLGINQKDANGELRNGADIMEDAIKKLAAMENITERNVLGAQLFSGAWKDLAPILALGSDGIEKARKQAQDLGLVMNREALEAANNFRIELETLNAQLGQIGKNIGMKVIPVLNTMIKGFKDLRGLVEETWKELGKGVQDADLQQINDDAQLYLNRGLVKNIEEGQRKAAENLLSQLEKQRTYWNAYYGDVGEITDREERIAARRRLEGFDNQIAAIKRFIAQAGPLQAEAQNEPIEALGKIGELRAQLAAAEQSYISAATEAEAARHLQRMNNLQTEIQLLEGAIRGRTASETQGSITSTMGAPQRMTPLAPTAIGIEPINPEVTIAQNLFNKSLEETARLQEQAALAAQKNADMMQSLSYIAEGAAYQIGEAFGQLAAKGGQATTALIAQAVAQAMASIITQIAATVPFPANIALIAGAGVFSGIIKSQIPAFADGGMAFGPTLGLMGEYANARTNPEVIAPLDKLQSMMGGGAGEVEFKIRGDVIYGVLKKYEGRLKQNA